MTNTSISERIRLNYSKMTDVQKEISNYMLNNEQDVAFLNLYSLSSQIGVSISSITRFSVDLGFSGYSEMQELIRKNLQLKLHPTHRLSSGMGSNENNIYAHSFKKDMKDIEQVMELNDESVMRSIVDSMLEAKNIYIIGYRSSYTIATYLNSILQSSLGNVTLINNIENITPELLLRMTESDLLISISFPRYNIKTIDFTKQAKKRGTKIVAISDMVSSPLVQSSDLYLLSKFEGVSFHNSYVSTLSLINSLCADLANRLGNTIKKRLNSIDELNDNAISHVFKPKI